MPLEPADTPPPIVTLDPRGIAQLAKALVEQDGPANPDTHRRILAIAGIPGSGKSTLAHALTDTLNRARPGSALLLAMDGFHMTNDKLDRLHLRERKGAPQTFEAQRYIKLLTELRDRSRTVRVPVFDRDLDEPVYTNRPGHSATGQTRFVITEGNYLLLDELPWTAVAELAMVTVWLDTPAQQARRWVIERHVRFGLTPEQAEQWYASNDALNTRHILDHSRHADRIARWPAGHGA